MEGKEGSHLNRKDRLTQKEVDGGWLIINNAEFQVRGSGEEKGRIPDIDKLDGLEGGYSVANGIIAYVDRDRSLRIAPYSSDRISALEEAGYEEDGSLWVPDMINKGDFTSPVVRDKWTELLGEDKKGQN